MQLPEICTRLRIYVGESGKWEHRPLYEALVLKAREEGLAGATVFRSPMGFGANSRIHTSKILNLSTDLPVVVELIDETEKIAAFVEKLQGMIQGGMITLEDVKVLHYRHNEKNG
jgi:PII-like signaling protein